METLSVCEVFTVVVSVCLYYCFFNTNLFAHKTNAWASPNRLTTTMQAHFAFSYGNASIFWLPSDFDHSLYLALPVKFLILGFAPGSWWPSA